MGSDIRTEWTNPCNGLCIIVLQDKAVDRGIITINCNYEIIISSQLKNENMDEYTRAWLMNYDHKKIIMPSKFLPDRRFLEYHNDMIFQR